MADDCICVNTLSKFSGFDAISNTSSIPSCRLVVVLAL